MGAARSVSPAPKRVLVIFSTTVSTHDPPGAPHETFPPPGGVGQERTSASPARRRHAPPPTQLSRHTRTASRLRVPTVTGPSPVRLPARTKYPRRDRGIAFRVLGSRLRHGIRSRSHRRGPGACCRHGSSWDLRSCWRRAVSCAGRRLPLLFFALHTGHNGNRPDASERNNSTFGHLHGFVRPSSTNPPCTAYVLSVLGHSLALWPQPPQLWHWPLKRGCP